MNSRQSSTRHRSRRHFFGIAMLLLACTTLVGRANAQSQADSGDRTSPAYEPSKSPTEQGPAPFPPQRRGYVGARVAVFIPVDDRRDGAFSMDLAGSVPLPRRVFVDINASVLAYRDDRIFGSPSIGVRHVAHASPLLWVDYGIDVGIPVPPPENSPYWYETAPLYYVQGGWDTQRFLPKTLSFRGHVTFDISTKMVLVRIETVPFVTIDMASSHPRVTGDVFFRPLSTDAIGLQHAIEIQSQGWIGGGGRLQAVVFDLDRLPLFIPAVEAYAFLERKRLFGRLGVMLPVNMFKGFGNDELLTLQLAMGMRL